MTTQSASKIVVRFVACYGNLQRLELVADRLVVDGALFGDYTIINVDTAFDTDTLHPSKMVGDRVRQDYIDFLTYATPLEACQAQVEQLKDDLYLANMQAFTHDKGSSARQNIEQYIVEQKALLVIAEAMLAQQQELSSREHYVTTSDYIIQIEHPMAVNGGEMAGAWVLLAGECSLPRFMAFDPHDTSACLEEYALYPVRYVFPSTKPTMVGEETAAMNQKVLALVEQAVAAKGLEVQIPSEKLLDCHFHYFGNWDHWYAMMRWETNDRHDQAVFRHVDLMLVFPQQFEIRTKCIKALV